jgi:hypothetical protein
MRLRLLRLLLAAPLLACLPHPAPAADPPGITNRVRLDIDLQPDGRSTRTLRLERRAGTDAAANELALFRWPYSPARDQVEIIAASIRKADGSTRPVDPARIRDVPFDAAAASAAGTGRREKLIPFRGLLAGDSIVVALRETVRQPRLPHLFSLALLYDPGQAWTDARVSITAPGTMHLQAEAAGPIASAVSDGALVTYAWRYRTTDARADSPAVMAPITRLPRLLVTNATDWTQVGRAYAALAAPSAAVTATVRARAEALTQGVAEPRAMAQRLYAWVARSIHATGVALGDDALPPRSADAVLATGSGDSQDVAALLAALLAAKGIASEPVLIGLDNQYQLDIPVPFAQLDHVLLYLPAFGLYADPTMGGARLGALPFVEYGKPVLHAVASGPVLRTTPVLPPGTARVTVTTTERLTPDTMIVGDTRTEASGPFALSLRQVARAMVADGLAAAATAQLRADGETGSGAFDQPPDPSPAEAMRSPAGDTPQAAPAATRGGGTVGTHAIAGGNDSPIGDTTRTGGDNDSSIGDTVRATGGNGSPGGDTVRATGDNDSPGGDTVRATGGNDSPGGDTARTGGDDSRPAYAIAGHFVIGGWPHLSADHRLSLPGGLLVLPRPGDVLIGPLHITALPASAPTPCFSGREVETLSLDVGPRYRVHTLPSDSTIRTDAFSFHAHWSQQGHVVTVRRELESRLTVPVCAGALRAATAQALQTIRADYAQTVALEPVP